jgi:hypothetical protein
MGTLVAFVTGLVIWVVLWALGSKGFDAFLITLTLGVVAVMLRTVFSYAPGRRR